MLDYNMNKKYIDSTEVNTLDFINLPLKIGNKTFENRLIQGPLAGFSCAPLRETFRHFQNPGYSVSEMVSALDVLTKHRPQGRYLFKSPREGRLSYQLSGVDPQTIAKAAQFLETLGADLIDINCGCPQPKIRKKGAGSALLENTDTLQRIISITKAKLNIPLTVKIRIQTPDIDVQLAQMIEQSGADALIVHGRRWVDNYETPVHPFAIQNVKNNVKIPVIANGDISDITSLETMVQLTRCDGFMISRAGCGKPHLYEQLLSNPTTVISLHRHILILQEHLLALCALENEYTAMLQARSLLKYYLKPYLIPEKYFSITSVEKLINTLLHDIINI
jgi:tRNA-dihydrouridine synthase B